MASQALNRSDFDETYAVHAALRHALKSSLFGKDPAAKRAAQNALKKFESDKTIYGRQCKMIRLMKNGATVDELRKGLKSSRRTIFRYFIDLENAGIDLKLDGLTYRVSRGLLRLV
jgi:hypothetical protein